jgi:hypothetical protein
MNRYRIDINARKWQSEATANWEQVWGEDGQTLDDLIIFANEKLDWMFGYGYVIDEVVVWHEVDGLTFESYRLGEPQPDNSPVTTSRVLRMDPDLIEVA